MLPFLDIISFLQVTDLSKELKSFNFLCKILEEHIVVHNEY